MAYLIKTRSGRTDGRIWKTKRGAEQHIRAVIKNNPLKQRRMTGFIGMRTIKVKRLYPRHKIELKKAKKFIFD